MNKINDYILIKVTERNALINRLEEIINNGPLTFMQSSEMDDILSKVNQIDANIELLKKLIG